MSHHQVPGVLQQKQGIVRQVTPFGLLALDIGLSLARALAIPLAQALEMAASLIEAKGRDVELPGVRSIRVSADIDAIAADLNSRLERAVEMTPIPKRGRPSRK